MAAAAVVAVVAVVVVVLLLLLVLLLYWRGGGVVTPEKYLSANAHAPLLKPVIPLLPDIAVVALGGAAIYAPIRFCASLSSRQTALSYSSYVFPSLPLPLPLLLPSSVSIQMCSFFYFPICLVCFPSSSSSSSSYRLRPYLSLSPSSFRFPLSQSLVFGQYFSSFIPSLFLFLLPMRFLFTSPP